MHSPPAMTASMAEPAFRITADRGIIRGSHRSGRNGHETRKARTVAATVPACRCRKRLQEMNLRVTVPLPPPHWGGFPEWESNRPRRRPIPRGTTTASGAERSRTPAGRDERAWQRRRFAPEYREKHAARRTSSEGIPMETALRLFPPAAGGLSVSPSPCRPASPRAVARPLIGSPRPESSHSSPQRRRSWTHWARKMSTGAHGRWACPPGARAWPGSSGTILRS